MTSDIDVAAALVVLAKHGIPTDIQDLLVYGQPQEGIRRGALVAALASVRPKPTTSDRDVADGIMDAIPKHPAFPLVDWRHSESGLRHRDAIEAALASVREEERETREEMEEALQRIVRWADAYPLDIFPEPDFAKAHALLQAGGMTLDAISASNMRHVVEGVGNIARDAIRSRQTPTGTGESK